MERLKTIWLWILNFCRCVLQCLWLFLPGIASILVSLALFISLSQGQDVIIQVSEYWHVRVWTIFGIFIWAYAIWYSSRLVGYLKEHEINEHTQKCEGGIMCDEDKMMLSFLEHLPRLMAFNAFLAIQAAILALPHVQATLWHPLPISCFIIVNNLLYFCYYSIFNRGNKKSIRNVLWAITGTVIAVANLIVWVYVISNAHAKLSPDHVYFLAWCGLTLFILQAASLYFFVVRKDWLNLESDDKPKDIVVPFTNKILFHTGDKSEQAAFNYFSGMVLIGGIFYLCCVISPLWAHRFGSLAFILTAFGVLINACNIIIHISRKLNVNFFVILIIISFTVSHFYDPYKVRTIAADPTRDSIYNKRPTILNYFKAWVHHKDRKEIIDSSKSFDVYLELADGGASRSGYWVASVLSALEDCTRDSAAIRFSNHLFCLSGTSGGTVGNATFYTMLYKTQGHDSDFTMRAQKFLGCDFLTTTMSHYLGPDIWGHYGFLNDRAGALEAMMDHAADSMYAGAFSGPLNTYLDSTGRLPVFFFNTTEVQHGMPAIVSPVKIADFSNRYDVLNILDDSCSKQGNSCYHANIRLSTAVILSARFPYISPAGELGNLYFVDGGYFDNSGAGIVNEMMIKIDSFINSESTDPKNPNRKEDSSLYSKLHFHVVHITNTPYSNTKVTPISSIANTLAAPLLTVLNTYTSQTNVNDGRLAQYFSSDTSGKHIIDLPVNLYHDYGNDLQNDTTEGYPMNWVISDYNLKRMNYQLRERIDSLKKQKKYGLVRDSCTFKIYTVALKHEE